MQKQMKRWRMNFDIESLVKLNIKLSDFREFVASPKLALDYAEAIFAGDGLSYAKIRVAQKRLGALVGKGGQASVSGHFIVDRIRTPVVWNQYEHLGKLEKKTCSYALIVFVYMSITKLSEIEQENILNGKLTDGPKEITENIYSEVTSELNKEDTSKENRENESVNNATFEGVTGHPLKVEDPSLPEIPEEGTGGHDRLFEGMNSMFESNQDTNGQVTDSDEDELDINTMG